VLASTAASLHVHRVKNGIASVHPIRGDEMRALRKLRALTSQSLEFHRSGKLRVLAVTSPERPIAAPELPTVAEAGFPGLTNQSTIGPVAPAGTPKPIEQIAHAVRTALAEPAYQQKLIESGFEASPDTTPEKSRRRLEADVVFWTPVVEAIGLKIN
jgi:tripartite-type tricarboxylate transporter receptor subunit TctC